jgi:hypothetical protein
MAGERAASSDRPIPVAGCGQAFYPINYYSLLGNKLFNISDIDNSRLLALFTYESTLLIVIYVYFLDSHGDVSFPEVTSTNI